MQFSTSHRANQSRSHGGTWSTRFLCFALVLAATLCVPRANGAPTTERILIVDPSVQITGNSTNPSVSADGRYVAFQAICAQTINTLLGDAIRGADGYLDPRAPGISQIFMRDRTLGTTAIVSVASNGTWGNATSQNPAISGDGRYVAFRSSATNLVAGDTNGHADIFVHDCQTGVTEIISNAYDGTPGDNDAGLPCISADGRYVAYYSMASNMIAGDTNATYDVFLRDRLNSTTERVSVASDGTEANGGSSYLSMTPDGRYIAFYSGATNLVSGDTNGYYDIFVRDRTNGTTERVSVGSGGTEGDNESYNPCISADGRYVAFASKSTNLVPGDTNASYDIFVHDRTNNTTERVSVASDGTQSNGYSYTPTISGDGRYVAFQSPATNLVANDTNGVGDMFLHDRQTGVTTRLSVATDGTQADKVSSLTPVISRDGSCVVFGSNATNLVVGDTNNLTDIFVRQLSAQTSISVDPVASGVGTGVTLSAVLATSTGGAPISGATLTFSVDSDSAGSAVTGADGVASLTYKTPLGSGLGSRTITAEFAGSPDYAASSGTASMSVGKGDCGLSLYAVSGLPGQAVTLRVILGSGPMMIAGRTVSFAVDGAAAGAGVTGVNGVASCAYAIPTAMPAGLHNITAVFDGSDDADFNSTLRTTAALTVVKAGVSLSVYPSIGSAGHGVVLRTLLYGLGLPLVGKVVSFSVDGTPVDSGTTDATGTASVSYAIPVGLATGPHNVTVVFDGSSDTTFKSSSRTTAALTVRKANTALSIYAAKGSAGDTIRLRTLLYGLGLPLVGKIVSFSVDGTPVDSGTTDATGTAGVSYTIPEGLGTGVHNITVTFDGSSDLAYAGSTRSTPALTVR